MDETIDTQTSNTNYAKREAEAARKTLNPNYNARRIAVGAAAIGGIGAALLTGQLVQNQNVSDKRIASVQAEYQNDQNILNEIDEKALASVDPASIVGFFNMTPGSTIISKSTELIRSLDLYKNADQTSRNFIDFTILQSGMAQGIYQPEEPFVVAEEQIDGQNTLIVQNGTGVQLSTIPAPDTH